MEHPHDEARLGLVREVLEIVLGLSQEVEDRVMNLIRGSIDSQDIRTPEMRQRIGPRAMKYLTNAIDLARSEGAERHDEEDIDLTKQERGDLEPGHKHHVHFEPEENDMREGFTFKDFLINETLAMIDTEDPDGVAKLKQRQRMDPQRVAAQNAADTVNAERAAKENPDPQTSALERRKAQLQRSVADADRKLAAMRDKQKAQQGM